MTGPVQSQQSDERAIPPDECDRCTRKMSKPWLAHLIPGATMWCGGEDPEKWRNGGPRA